MANNTKREVLNVLFQNFEETGARRMQQVSEAGHSRSTSDAHVLPPSQRPWSESPFRRIKRSTVILYFFFILLSSQLSAHLIAEMELFQTFRFRCLFDGCVVEHYRKDQMENHQSKVHGKIDPEMMEDRSLELFHRCQVSMHYFF